MLFTTKTLIFVLSSSIFIILHWIYCDISYILDSENDIEDDSKSKESSESSVNAAPIRRSRRPVLRERIRAHTCIGLPIEESLQVPGFEDFAKFIGAGRNRHEMLHMNNITTVRCFLSIFKESFQPLSMRLLAGRDNIQRYVDGVLSIREYTPKTRLSRIEGIKRAIDWLYSCTYSDECEYAKIEDRETLGAIKMMLNQQCSALRPAAKADEGRASLLSENIARGTYIDPDRFELLGSKILNKLREQKEFVNHLVNRGISRGLKRASFDFERTLVAALFVLIPTQRCKVITFAEVEDIAFNDNGGSLSIKIEKTSYRLNNVQASIGGFVYFPPAIATYLGLWIDRFRRHLVGAMSGNRLWIDMGGWPLISASSSRMVAHVTTSLVGARLTPLALRRLRATFWYESIMNSDSSDVAKRDRLEEYARACNQSLDIFLKYYVMACPDRKIEEHKRLTNAANERAFETSNVVAKLFEGDTATYQGLNREPSRRVERDALWMPSKIDYKFKQTLKESESSGKIKFVYINCNRKRSNSSAATSRLRSHDCSKDMGACT